VADKRTDGHNRILVGHDWDMRAIALALVGLLAACTETTGSGVSSAPSIESSPKVPPTLIPDEALPVPEPSPWPIQPDEKRDRATTPDVAVGQRRPFRLYTHCGIDLRVDFDGSFWQSYSGPDTPAIGNPFQKGTMTLLLDDVAVFRFETQGDDTAIYFIRNDAPKPEVGCW
jgi:hypothetical protein